MFEFSKTFCFLIIFRIALSKPYNINCSLGIFRVRSPLLTKSNNFLSFPVGTKMFQFPTYIFIRILTILIIIWLCHIRFPHSDIIGSKLFTSSPILLAGNTSFIAIWFQGIHYTPLLVLLNIFKYS